MSNKAAIFGAYGNFGKLIARTLLKSGIPLILLGRKQHQLSQLEADLKKDFPKVSIESSIKDINDDMIPFLKQKKPKVLINTCGPFQTANYRIVSNCIVTKTNYVDLADGRQFVTQMKPAHHTHALRNKTTIITGASSVPGLSSAVIENFKNEFSNIQSITYGISPGQKTTRGGPATVKGVMGYIGKPIRPSGDQKAVIYGWQDLYMEKYPQLGWRLFGNCDIPDLDLFPEAYGIKNVKFSAGMQSKLLHLSIWLTSYFIRLGLPLNLPKYSDGLLKLSRCFDWMGTDAGGMHIKIRGTQADGRRIQRKWHLIVKNGQGPNVPAIPSIVLARKICLQDYSLPGVHPCVGLVSLQQYLDGLRDFSVETYTTKSYL